MPDMDQSLSRHRLSPPIYQWECPCRVPPVVLGTYDLSGHIRLKDRDRYWQLDGRVATNCPKCGKPHLLDLRIDPGILATLPHPWRDGGD